MAEKITPLIVAGFVDTFKPQYTASEVSTEPGALRKHMRTARRKHVKHMCDPDPNAVIPADAKRVCGKPLNGIVPAPEDKVENVRCQPSPKAKGKRVEREGVRRSQSVNAG